jgi:CDP-diacylglycerol--glycerol-3-phosphate 3-phosphatidyltransferase
MTKGVQTNLGAADLFSAANLVSLGRVVLAPIILVLLAAETREALYAAFAIACMAGVSDIADGYLARRQGSASGYGRYVDGACDAIFNLAVFLGFLATGWMPVLLFTLVYFAEIVVPYLGAFSKQIGHPFDVRWSAKVKTTVHPIAQIVLIGSALVGSGVTPDPLIAAFAFGVAVIASIAYVVDHAAYAIRHVAISDRAA